MFLSMNTIENLEKLYASLGELTTKHDVTFGERHRLDRGRQFAVLRTEALTTG